MGNNVDLSYSDAVNAGSVIYCDRNGCKNCGRKIAYRYTKSRECENCALTAALAAGPLWPATRADAISAGKDRYFPQPNHAPKLCPTGAHPLTLSVNGGPCPVCFPDEAAARVLRAAARNAGQATYQAHCSACTSERPHSVAHGRCLTCYTADGKIRKGRAISAARIAARNAGQATYQAHCSACTSERPHSVAHGRCLTCYNAKGAPRAAKRTPRAAARNAGQATYQAHCSACTSERPHSVAHGRCLTCYTAAGVPRVSTSPRNPARAEARRQGQKTYLADCADCGGQHAHSVLHGKCLACHTTAGQRRSNRHPQNDAQRLAEWLPVLNAMPGSVMSKEQAQALGCPIWREADGLVRWIG